MDMDDLLNPRNSPESQEFFLQFLLLGNNDLYCGKGSAEQEWLTVGSTPLSLPPSSLLDLYCLYVILFFPARYYLFLTPAYLSNLPPPLRDKFNPYLSNYRYSPNSL